jgi:frataxin-like iron-binding protein CyaY
MPSGMYYDKDCRGGHHINWSHGKWKCDKCGRLFIKELNNNFKKEK